jgi:hypothetical protein
MASDPRDLRYRLRRYRELYQLNPDPKAREVLEQSIKELEQQLGENREPD